MYGGVLDVNVDAKGRMAMPTRYREALLAEGKGELIITVDYQNPCLLIYTAAEWHSVAQKINNLPNSSRGVRHIQRTMLGHATEVTLDAQGRFLIGPRLRDYAGIEKSIVITWLSNKFELWASEKWDEVSAMDFDSDPEMLDAVRDLSI